jgi:anti-sigma B factor antagonist
MQVNLVQHNGVIIVQPDAASLDAANARAFRDAIGPVIDRHEHIVLDLSQVNFVDSAGIGAMISSLRRASEKQAKIRLCELRRPVRALFDLMRMHRVFDIHNCRDDALRGMAA